MKRKIIKPFYIKLVIITMFIIIISLYSILRSRYHSVTFDSCLSDKADIHYIIGACPYYLDNEKTDIVLSKAILKYDSNVVREAYLAFFSEGDNIDLYNKKKKIVLQDCIEKGGCQKTYIQLYSLGESGFPKEPKKALFMYHKILDNDIVSNENYRFVLSEFLEFVKENPSVIEESSYIDYYNLYIKKNNKPDEFLEIKLDEIKQLKK